MTATAEAPPPTDSTDQGAAVATSGHSARRRIAVVLIVIGSILAPLAVDALWLKRTMLDTDRFVSEFGPLASDPEIQAFAAGQVADQLIAQADLETRLGDALPENLKFLDGTLGTAGDQLIRQASSAVMASDQFERLWNEALRVSHAKIVAVLTGDTDIVKVDNGVVSIDLSSLRDDVRARVATTGLARFLPAESNTPLVITLYESQSLADAQSFVKLLRFLGFVLPFLVIICYGSAIALALDRRKAVFRVGLGLSIAMFVQLLAMLLGRSLYLDAVASFLPRPPASAIWDMLITFPRTSTRAVLVVGLLMLLGAALLGSTALAVRTRAVLAAGVGRAGTGIAGDREPAAVTVFFARYRTPLDVVVLVLAALVLLGFDRVTPGNLLLLVIVTLLLIGLVHVLAAAGASGVPDADHRPPAAPDGADGSVDRPLPPSAAPVQTTETRAASPTLEQPGTATTVEDAAPARGTWNSRWVTPTVEQEPAPKDSPGS